MKWHTMDLFLKSERTPHAFAPDAAWPRFAAQVKRRPLSGCPLKNKAMCNNVTLRPIESLSDTDIDILVSLLNDDSDLRKWLYQDEKTIGKLTRDEFIKTGQEWALKKNAKVYCIFTDTPIGQISISHITSDGYARIGYWITSREWRKGYGTKAFELAIQIARELGIREVSANIDKNNAASLAVWQKYDHVQSVIEQNKVRLRLKI